REGMTPEQKTQVRTRLLAYLEAVAQEQPNLLVDVLLAGDGYNFLNRLLQGEEMAARQRAQVLNNLLQAVRQIAPPNTYQPPPQWQPPTQPSPGFPPLQQQPEEYPDGRNGSDRRRPEHLGRHHGECRGHPRLREVQAPEAPARDGLRATPPPARPRSADRRRPRAPPRAGALQPDDALPSRHAAGDDASPDGRGYGRGHRRWRCCRNDGRHARYRDADDQLLAGALELSAGSRAQPAAEHDEQAAGRDEKGSGQGGAPQAAERAPPSEESAARRSGSRAADVVGGLAGTDVRHLDGRHLADGCGADGKCRAVSPVHPRPDHGLPPRLAGCRHGWLAVPDDSDDLELVAAAEHPDPDDDAIVADEHHQHA